MREKASEYDPDAVENAEAAGLKADIGGKEPSIGGAPLSSFLSEDLMMWYLAEVKSGRERNWYLFFMSLGMRPFQHPGDSALQRKYARLKKAGVSKDAILTAAISSAGHKVFDAILIFFGMVFTTIALAPIIGGILGNALYALAGGAPQTGITALAGIFLLCIPGPVIGAVLGYMFVKDSNAKRAKRISEKIDELDRTS
ncbi:MAG: hypothetical protein NTX79_05140 [Candidatus Micrarchaeota archaeon]|nr:hypothetical protein [Candidatus Micrarchaeota archaeon]